MGCDASFSIRLERDAQGGSIEELVEALEVFFDEVCPHDDECMVIDCWSRSKLSLDWIRELFEKIMPLTTSFRMEVESDMDSPLGYGWDSKVLSQFDLVMEERNRCPIDVADLKDSVFEFEPVTQGG